MIKTEQRTKERYFTSVELEITARLSEAERCAKQFPHKIELFPKHVVLHLPSPEPYSGISTVEKSKVMDVKKRAARWFSDEKGLEYDVGVLDVGVLREETGKIVGWVSHPKCDSIYKIYDTVAHALFKFVSSGMNCRVWSSRGICENS